MAERTVWALRTVPGAGFDLDRRAGCGTRYAPSCMAEDDSQREPTLKILTTVPGNAEATMVVGDLEAAGVPATPQLSTRADSLWGGPTPVDIYVDERDLDRAREVLNTEAMSEDELLQAEEEAGTQPTQPKGENEQGAA